MSGTIPQKKFRLALDLIKMENNTSQFIAYSFWTRHNFPYTVDRYVRIFVNFQGDIVAGTFGHNQEDTHRNIDKTNEEINQDEIEDQQVHARFMARGVRPRDHQQNERTEGPEERHSRRHNRPRQQLSVVCGRKVYERFIYKNVSGKVVDTIVGWVIQTLREQ